jgi:hypothetical protein
MSVKSGLGKSTDLNTTEDLQINEILLNKINKILSIVIEENKTLKNYKEKVLSQRDMSFTSYKKPSLSIKDYLFRIQNYTEAEDNTIIIALMYIDRLSDISSILLTPFNVHRILFVSILLAIKYNEDICFGFDFYAKIAGMPISDLKKMERDFVYLIKFKFFIDKEEFENYKSYIDEIEYNENKK